MDRRNLRRKEGEREMEPGWSEGWEGEGKPGSLLLRGGGRVPRGQQQGQPAWRRRPHAGGPCLPEAQLPSCAVSSEQVGRMREREREGRCETERGKVNGNPMKRATKYLCDAACVVISPVLVSLPLNAASRGIGTACRRGCREGDSECALL